MGGRLVIRAVRRVAKAFAWLVTELCKPPLLNQLVSASELTFFAVPGILGPSQNSMIGR